MKTMDFVFADYLYPNQLMEGDTIKYENEFYIVKAIDLVDDDYLIAIENDFEEVTEVTIKDDVQVEWYVIPEE